VLRAKDIKLYPSTALVNGNITYEEYVDSMARCLLREMVIDRRVDYSELRKLVDYAEQNHERLNRV
jgi:hypothetical protein